MRHFSVQYQAATPATADAFAVAEMHRGERAKWDTLAEAERASANGELPYRDFAEYARRSGTVRSIADFIGDVRGRRVLEYGCGTGKTTMLLARSGARVSAFDLSPVSIHVARARADRHGLEVDLAVAAGESLPYESETFDLVFGKAILHHLDAELGSRELHRVLRPGGRAVFVEPMGMNPLLNLVRDRAPYRHKTPRGSDCPLSYADIHAWGRRFRTYACREVQLVCMLERALGFGRALPRLRRLDDALLARVPALRRYCRYVGVCMIR